MFPKPVLALALLAPAPLLAQAAAPAAPAAQPLPRAQFISTMDGEFRKVDADKDGQLTRIEIDQFQKVAAVAMARRRNQALFARLDADKNGQISPAEFASLPINPPRTDPGLLLKFDTSKDGKVSLIEHRTATLANFDRLDTDKNGVVSPAEMKAGGIK